MRLTSFVRSHCPLRHHGDSAGAISVWLRYRAPHRSRRDYVYRSHRGRHRDAGASRRARARFEQPKATAVGSSVLRSCRLADTGFWRPSRAIRAGSWPLVVPDLYKRSTSDQSSKSHQMRKSMFRSSCAELRVSPDESSAPTVAPPRTFLSSQRWARGSYASNCSRPGRPVNPTGATRLAGSHQGSISSAR